MDKTVPGSGQMNAEQSRPAVRPQSEKERGKETYKGLNIRQLSHQRGKPHFDISKSQKRAPLLVVREKTERAREMRVAHERHPTDNDLSTTNFARARRRLKASLAC